MYVLEKPEKKILQMLEMLLITKEKDSEQQRMINWRQRK